MVTVTMVLKVLILFVAELISSITDWFQTKPAWANLEVMEDTELKTTGGGESHNRSKELFVLVSFHRSSTRKHFSGETNMREFCTKNIVTSNLSDSC